MKKQWVRCGIVCLTFALLSQYAALTMRAQQKSAVAASAVFTKQERKKFIALHPIDAHTHVYQYTPQYVALLQKLHMHTLDIMVVADNMNPERRELGKESDDVFRLVHNSDGSVFACTTFDAYLFKQPDFATHAIDGINREFERGAVAVKLWKNVGMEVKDSAGRYILPDDPIFAPIYRDIAAHHKTLTMHLADPDTAWLPPNPNASDMSYYLEHPEWYMYKIPGSPSKEQILQARDHVLAANPDLRVVGAHLGSMEANLARIAEDLDRYPNFAVDLTARLPYIMKLPRSEAIAFFTKYQDRLIYGTDTTFYPGADVTQFLQLTEGSYVRDWRFFSTGATLTFRGIQTKGLALPDSILRKIYHDNALHWYAGIN